MPIEFIDDAEDDDEPSAPPPARRSLLYRFGAVTVVLVAVIAWALTRPADNGTTGAAKPSTSPTSARTTFVPRSPSMTFVPDTRSCQLDAPVMIPIASAMKRFLPALDLADLTAFRCVRGGGIDGRVVFEAISGRYHRLTIDVEAALRTNGPPVVSPSLGSDGGRKVLVAQIEALAAGLKVDVNAWGRRGDRAPIDAMRTLADFVSLNVVL